MALNPAQKAVLGIRIVAARCCEAHADDEVGHADAVAAELQAWAKDAKVTVRQDGDVQRRLEAAATALEQKLAEFEQLGVAATGKEFRNAIELLRRLGGGVLPGPGDGPALLRAQDGNFAPSAAHCKCGFLELAGQIERDARRAYDVAHALRHGFPEVHYATAIVEDPSQSLGPFRMGGAAGAEGAIRVVYLKLQDEDLRAYDLTQIPYVFFHELVCHAFQAVGKSDEVQLAPPSCPWTEGWMDKLAFEMARRWIAQQHKQSQSLQGSDQRKNAHGHWITLTGLDADDAIQRMHALRYVDKEIDKDSKVSKQVARSRRKARRAFHELCCAFVENNMANFEKAKEVVEQFSLVANAHPDATPELLRDISRQISLILLTVERAHQRVRLARACARFVADGRLDRFVENMKKVLNEE